MNVVRIQTVIVLGLLAAGCGNSLSSLDSVQRSAREVYPMTLGPDFGRRGDTLTVKVIEMDPVLQQVLNQSVSYPTEISFGEDTYIKSFGTDEQDRLQIEVFISPHAKEGERLPTLIFSVSGELVEARGRFWVLPALHGQPG